MGTVFSVDVRAPGVEPRLLDDVVSWLHDVDARFSTYRVESEISQLRVGNLCEQDCSADVQVVLDRCRELERETDGYFSLHPDGRLDPSGLVKGWAIERASAMLRAGGSTNHCVNGGGDVQCAGSAALDQPWRIGISHPLETGMLAGIVTGTDLAVATSGSAERGAHIIDPHTGRRPDALASVTVVGRALSTVDAYATAAFAMGADARAWLENLDGYWAIVVASDGSKWDNLPP